MAAISTADKQRAARIIARKLYGDTNAVCPINTTDIEAAVQAIDDAFEGTPAALTNGGQSVVSAIASALPATFASATNAAGKATALAVWAGVKYGVASG